MRIALAGAILLLTAFQESADAQLQRQADWLTAAEVLATLDGDCMACGPDAYREDGAPHPMAYALLASTGALLSDEDLARSSADWLADNSAASEGATGWGLGFEWDAFSDGSVNPSDTVYGITTALAVAGLLDAYGVTNEKRYLTTAEAALDYYKEAFTRTEAGGYFWYSDQPSDDISVYNVTSMLAGQYARAGALLDRKDLHDLADLAASHLMDGLKKTDGLPFWPYSDRNERPNDLVHAAYVVQGLVEHSRHGDVKFDLDGHDDYLLSFFAEGGLMEFSPVHDLRPALSERPARLWGAGMWIHTLVELGRTQAACDLSVVDPYRDHATGGFLNVPGSDAVGEPRMVAHLAIGLAALENSPQGCF